MAIPVAPLGWKLVGIGLALAAVLGLATRSWAWASIGLVLAAFCLFFFRDPEREIRVDPNVALAPGDGTVLSVEKEGPGGLTTMRIFLSIFDVHVQRAPLAGTVRKVEYQEGGFRIANALGARKNERNVMTFDSDAGSFVVEQITGAVARRIRGYVAEGEAVRQGQRIGLIYFGSQVALHLPEGWSFTVAPGDRVKGGLTVVARRG